MRGFTSRAPIREGHGAQFPGGGSEPIADHLWCRRNYTLLATDGEWTRLPAGQPLLESGPLAGTRTPVGRARNRCRTR